jgi:outer membrane protein
MHDLPIKWGFVAHPASYVLKKLIFANYFKKIQLKKVIIILITCLGFGYINLNAQSKFGYVNAGELLFLMPEMKTVEHVLDSFEQALTALYQKDVEEFNEAVKKCDATEPGPMKDLCQEELAKKQEYLYKAQQVYKDELTEKQNKLMAPLNEKILKCVKEVAIEKGLNYIFDISLGAVLYWDEKDNVNKDVRKKLGIAEDATLPNNNDK